MTSNGLMKAVLALGLVAGCKPGGAEAGRGKRELRYAVEVAPVESRKVEYAVHAVGSVEAYERVHIAARVAGAVEEVRFREGDVVEKGQIVARIDAERHAIAVRSAQAVLARAEAEDAEARAGLARRERIVGDRPELIPVEELETWRTKARATAAQVAEARAALDSAELNQRLSSPVAPAAGMIETRSVETGQYVQPGAPIATLVRRDPLLLRFQVPEREARSLGRGMTAMFTASGAEPMKARITHVSQSANESSRMVLVTAEIDDPRRSTLRPGTFAEVTVPIGARESAPVVPQMAIRPSERGFLSYVIEGDIARERVVTLGMRTAEGLVEIQNGLAPGELLVVRGGEALAEGYKVNVTRAAGAAAGGGTGETSSRPAQEAAR